MSDTGRKVVSKKPGAVHLRHSGPPPFTWNSDHAQCVTAVVELINCLDEMSFTLALLPKP